MRVTMSFLPVRLCLGLCLSLGVTAAVLSQSSLDRQRLLTPTDPAFTVAAPAVSRVRFDTTKGPLVIEIVRAWAPRGADRFVNLVRHGYYDEAKLFRVRPETWVQFGIAADPQVAQAWRTATFPDDPFRETNARGTISFAFAVPDGRTTQVFINLKDNAASHDKEPFVPFGRVVEGMDVADAFNAEYREGIGGIRAGQQDAGFAGGNAFFDREFPRLDVIRRATVVGR